MAVSVNGRELIIRQGCSRTACLGGGASERVAWQVLLATIFLRPFVSEYAFSVVGFWYTFFFAAALATYLALVKGAAFSFTPLHIAVALFAAMVVISIIPSGCERKTQLELYYFAPNLLVFFLGSSLSMEKRIQLLKAVLVAAVTISAYAFYQYFFGFSHLQEYLSRTPHDAFAEEFLSKKRVYAFFVSPNIFASYLLMAIYISAGFLLARPRQKKTIPFLAGALAIMVAALSLTKSLGGILALGITGLVFCYLFFRYLARSGQAKIPAYKRMGIILLVACIILCALLVWQRLPQLFDLRDANNSISQRFHYWKASLKIAKDFLWTGVGWRSFGTAYAHYKPFDATMSNYAHNVFLQIFSETGIMGLFIFLGIIFLFITHSLRRIKGDQETRGLAIGLFCAGLAFLVHNSVDISFYFTQASFLWWLILGMSTRYG